MIVKVQVSLFQSISGRSFEDVSEVFVFSHRHDQMTFLVTEFPSFLFSEV